jgi:DNA-binding GntR family transcriptional regulator
VVNHRSIVRAIERRQRTKAERLMHELIDVAAAEHFEKLQFEGHQAR